jgi:ATP-dependent DNA helicase RecG
LNIINECKSANLPEPRFECEFGGFSVTIYKDKYTENLINELDLNHRQIKAIMYLKENKFITNKIYQNLCSTSERTASRDLENLTEKNIFEKVGEKKGTKYKLIVGR